MIIVFISLFWIEIIRALMWI